ncbi:P1 family peptidase [bacterium]|nr:P1 family peptidase [bacterium]
MGFRAVTIAFALLALCALATIASTADKIERLRAREMGVKIGRLKTGPLNAITDVKGVKVGHATLTEGDNVRTGVTVVLPHGGNLFQEKVPAAIFLGNAFGKLAGYTQVEELGNIETPIALTNTLNIGPVVEGLVRYTLAQPGNGELQSINAVAGEVNDGFLSDIQGLHVRPKHVFEAIENAAGGPVPEGSVGGGHGARTMGYKSGIGTASRVVKIGDKKYTLGVLVTSNFGGSLVVDGIPVGRILAKKMRSAELGMRNEMQAALTTESTEDTEGNYDVSRDVGAASDSARSASHRQSATLASDTGASSDNDDDFPEDERGSCVVVIATDAPVLARNLKRLGARANQALGRVGSHFSNGSGDYFIAFSTHPDLRIKHGATMTGGSELENAAMNPLFVAAADATEEAILNALFRANEVIGREGHTFPLLPLDEVRGILESTGKLSR